MTLLHTILAACLVVGGFTGQNISVVYWLSSPISQYGVLLFANVWFPCFFGVLLAGYAIYRKDWAVFAVSDDREQCKLWKYGSCAQISFVVGFLNILNGFLIVYASPSSRTPPLIQAVLQNTGFLFSVPFSIWVLGDNKRYLSFWPIFSGLLVAASVAVSVLPTILQGNAEDGFSGSTIPWIIVYLSGMLPGAAYNTFQQLFLIRSGALKENVDPATVTRASLRMLFWCNVSQAVSLLLLWWIDILPWFGASTSLSEFWTNTVFSLSCSFGGPNGVIDGDASDCSSKFSTPQTWAFAFVVGYSFSYIGSAILNRESATFNMLCAVVTTMTTSLYFLIPGTNPNDESTPIWSVLVSLLLSLTGLILWKRWENNTPAHEQYALSAGSGWREGVFDKLLLDGSGNTFYDQTGGSRTNSLVDEDHAFRTENYEDEEEDEERHATLLKYATPNRR